MTTAAVTVYLPTEASVEAKVEQGEGEHDVFVEAVQDDLRSGLVGGMSLVGVVGRRLDKTNRLEINKFR